MSKFGSELAEQLYAISLDGGQDDEIGSVQEAGWFGLFLLEKAILVEDNQGFVDAWEFDSIPKTYAEWQSVEKQYEMFYESVEGAI